MAEAHGWRQRVAPVLCFVAGAAAALAQPPWGFLPGLLGWAALLRLIEAAPGGNRGSTFYRGWLGGCGYFLVCVWWLFEPFQVDAAHQGWMAPFAVALTAAGLALFWGAAALIYRWLAPGGATRFLVFVGVFAGAEWLRGHVLTGFPWDLPGETWRAGSPISQSAAVFGAYGLTWITLAIAAAPAVVDEGRKGILALVGGAAALAALLVFGAGRLAGAPTPSPAALRLRIVQADVRQASKYDPALFEGIVGRYVALTSRQGAPPPDVVIWPEGALPAEAEAYLAPDTWTRAAIVSALQPNQNLILGGYRVEQRDGRNIYFNSLFVLRRRDGELLHLGLYDKFRLVPFGEFIPLDSLAGRLGIKTMVHVGDGFSPGPRPRPLNVPGLPAFQPLICYEALYPGFTREGARAAGRPAWILNISNDAWFGETSGPLQHLNMASYRAIEEGLPMARATPTGVSAVVDAFGRPVASLGEGALGVIDTVLPPALVPTPFARLGDLSLLIMLAVSAAFARPRRW